MIDLIRLIRRLLQELSCFLLSLLAFMSAQAIFQDYELIQDSYSASQQIYAPSVKQNGSLLELKRKNADVIGWICLDNTGINEGLVQGRDNFEYVNQNIFKEFSLSGSLFLDSENSADLDECYVMIFGHSLYEGGKFSDLIHFEQPDYFETHLSGTLYTISSSSQVKSLLLEVWAICECRADENLIYNTAYANAHLDLIKAWVQEHAICMRPQMDPQKLVVLSTCSSQNSSQRILLFCSA